MAKVAVLRILINGPSYGYAIMQRTDWRSGKVYGVLQGLVNEGWVDTYNSDMKGGHGRPRVMYALRMNRIPQAITVVDEARRLLQ
jgi:DNA-binding PadR family transcriptional regulator